MIRLRGLHHHPLLLLWLIVVWVGLWGSPTPANILGGLVVAVALLVAIPLPEAPTHGRLRPLAAARYAGFFLLELVRASLIVLWQVLRPRAQLQQAVFAVEAAGHSDRLLTLVANSISLTPGTLTLEVDRDRAILYVHALDVDGVAGVADARASIERLQRLAAEAIGSTPDRARPADPAERQEEMPT